MCWLVACGRLVCWLVACGRSDWTGFAEHTAGTPAAERTLTWAGPGSPRPAPAVLGLKLVLEHEAAKLGVLYVDPARSQPLSPGREGAKL